LLSLKFCGKAETSLSMASGTGLYDLHKLEWDTELLKYLKLRPAALSTIGIEQQLLKKWQRRWPQLAEALWHPSIADGAANNVGSEAVDGSTAALMVGTSAALRVILNRPPSKIPKGLFCYRLDADRLVLGGALSDGGGFYDWLRRNLEIRTSDAALGKELRSRGPGARGLVLMPFFAGERSTGYNEFAAGSIHGLTIAHDSIDILQAAMESVAYRLAEILDQIESVTPVKRIIASGGALSASKVWPQIIADVLGRDLELFRESEASMRGAVLLALRTTGKIELSDTAAPRFSKIKFDPGTHAAYRPAFERHRAHYQNIDTKP
ncbi:MAG TPA: FGGY-family carbohydrate kinase, partial [Pyrinomonadaceae bacterium]|nr:FGGY-family carbohydrate kinase [Pyrinomonadaceae bacterium]